MFCNTFLIHITYVTYPSDNILQSNEKLEDVYKILDYLHECTCLHSLDTFFNHLSVNTKLQVFEQLDVNMVLFPLLPKILVSDFNIIYELLQINISEYHIELDLILSRFKANATNLKVFIRKQKTKF